MLSHLVPRTARNVWDVAAGVIGIAAVLGLATWARRQFIVITVSGHSMFPTYREGDRVLVRRRPLPALHAGDIVVIQAPDKDSGWRGLFPLDRRVVGHRWNIKRVVAVPGDQIPEVVEATNRTLPAGFFAVLGEHVASLDSRQLGLVPDHQLLGVVVRQLRHRESGRVVD